MVMSKRETTVTLISEPGENLSDVMKEATHIMIQSYVDKVVVIHNHKYTITKGKVSLVGDA